jgi:predicted dehydrogenase
MAPQVELAAGCSRGQKHLDFFGRRFNVDALYLDYREMFEKEQLDIAAIATPPGLHKEIVVAAVESGVRGIFCEKPMALSLSDADAIVEVCRQAGAVLSVNHSRRWRPGWLKAHELLQEGAIGKLVSMSGVCQGAKPHPAWEAEEEGPLLHDAVHLFDMFRFYAGDVQAATGTALKRWQPYAVEDDCQVIFEFEKGTSAVALVNELSRYTNFRMELHGTEGVMALADKGNRLYTSVQWTDHQREADAEIDWWSLEERPFPPHPEANALLNAVQELVHCMETGERPSSTGEDGVASVEMVMAIYESQLQGNKPVTLPLAQRDSALYRLRAAGQL